VVEEGALAPVSKPRLPVVRTFVRNSGTNVRTMGHDHSVIDRSTNHPGPPTSVISSLVVLAVRVAFFGGIAVLCLVMRSSETQTGNRNFLLVLAVIAGAVGLVMVVQSVLDLWWLRGRTQTRSAR